MQHATNRRKRWNRRPDTRARAIVGNVRNVGTVGKKTRAIVGNVGTVGKKTQAIVGNVGNVGTVGKKTRAMYHTARKKRPD